MARITYRLRDKRGRFVKRPSLKRGESKRAFAGTPRVEIYKGNKREAVLSNVTDKASLVRAWDDYRVKHVKEIAMKPVRLTKAKFRTTWRNTADKLARESYARGDKLVRLLASRTNKEGKPVGWIKTNITSMNVRMFPSDEVGISPRRKLKKRPHRKVTRKPKFKPKHLADLVLADMFRAARRVFGVRKLTSDMLRAGNMMFALIPVEHG